MSKVMAATPLPSATASREGVFLVLLVAATVIAFLGVPAASWRESPFDPCHIAAVGGVASTATLIVTWFMGDRAVRFEPLLAAGFLFVMPPIYVASVLMSPPLGSLAPWLYVELAAVPVYGALAVAGYRGRPALLALGIAAHGIAWDAWHYGHSSYIPDWYAIACLELDVGMALYIATRIPRWRAWRGDARAQRFAADVESP